MTLADITPDGRISVSSNWESKDLIKAIPGSSWDPVERHWTLPLGMAACHALRGQFGDKLRISPALGNWAREQRAQWVDEATARRGMLTLPDTDDDLTRFIKSWRGTGKFDLFPHQEAGAYFLAFHNRGCLLADEMGTGKTGTILSAMRLRKEMGHDPFPALVVTPNTVKANWMREVELWLPGAQAFVLAGSATKRRQILAAAKEHPAAVVVVNIEAVRLLSRLSPYGSIRLKRCKGCDKQDGEDITAAVCEVHVKEFNTFGFKTCALDEAHRVKDPKAKQTRALWSVFHEATVENRWALTGTPIASHPGDLWSLMHAVAPEDFQTRSKFVDRYAQVSWGAYGMEILGLNPATSTELFKFLDPRMRRVTKDLVLRNLPPKVRQIRMVEMSPKQAKVYASLEQEALAVLESGHVLTTASTLALNTRKLQLASSYCDVDFTDPADPASWVVTPKLPSSKIDEVMDIIREQDGAPTAIAAEHRRLLELLATKLKDEGIPFVQITGAVDEFERARAIELFQDGRVPIILFTYKAGGVGLNMTRANTLIRMQRSDSMIDNKQGEDRVHRIGSEIHDSINIIDLVAEGTIEEAQMENLQRKLDRLEEITRDRAARIAAGLEAYDLDAEEAAIMGSKVL